MPDHGSSSSTPFTIFDYLGLGFILEPPGVLVAAVMKGEALDWWRGLYAIPFVIIGSVFIYIGRNWDIIKTKWGARIVHIVDYLSLSYIALLAVFMMFMSILVMLPLFIWPPPQKTNVSSKSVFETPTERFIKNPFIEWEGGAGPIIFHAQYNRTGNNLAVFVQYGSFPSSGRPIIDGFINWERRKFQIDFKERFFRDAEMKSTIGLVSSVPGNQLILQIGDKEFASISIGITTGNYLCKIIIASQDIEESYIFAIISSRNFMGGAIRCR
jgi:hypothetical protein